MYIVNDTRVVSRFLEKIKSVLGLSVSDGDRVQMSTPVTQDFPDSLNGFQCNDCTLSSQVGHLEEIKKYGISW